MKTKLTSLLFFFALQMFAQHCPFDNKGILVVKVETEKTGHQIEMLQPILTYLDKNNKQIRVEFIQNKHITNEFLWKRYHTITSLNFSFAKDYFTAEIPMDKFKNVTIHLENLIGNTIGTYYNVKDEDIFDLHKNFGENWTEFKEGFSPKPLNSFKHLITLKTNTIELVYGTFYKEKGNKLYHKYKYENTIIFYNQKDLDEVIELIPYKKIDFSKKIVLYQHFVGDCKFKINLYKINNPKENTITIMALHKYGGCRASGRKSVLSIINIPNKETKLLFENVDYEDYKYLNYSPF
jgi:hypothetical protein